MSQLGFGESLSHLGVSLLLNLGKEIKEKKDEGISRLLIKRTKKLTTQQEVSSLPLKVQCHNRKKVD